MSKTYSIVVFGATGFTGGLVAEYLAEHAPSTLSWAVAGRNQDKLTDLMERLRHYPCPPKAHLSASLSDPQSLATMTRATHVLLTTVGPYAEYGEPVVQACIEGRCDYVDITGEPQFVDRILDRYHDEAERLGLKLISCCGFDSIPHDLGVLYTIGELKPSREPVRIKGFVRSKGTFSGGTWHSAIRAMGNYQAHRAERRNRVRPKRTTARKVRGIKASIYYEKAFKWWGCPLPTIDPQIVLRSARALESYGSDFQYGHYVGVRNLSSVLSGVGGVSALFLLSQARFTRDLLLKVKDQGEGPDANQRAKSHFSVTFLAQKGSERLITKVSGGDPGYGETSKMIAESALALALDRDKTPDRHGVLTTASGIGTVLIDRLQAAGIRFEVLERD